MAKNPADERFWTERGAQRRARELNNDRTKYMSSGGRDAHWVARRRDWSAMPLLSRKWVVIDKAHRAPLIRAPRERLPR